MVFRYWSFSIDQDIKGSTVTMTIDGNDVPLEIQPYDDGHRLPTVVWEPDFSFKSITSDTKAEVTVTIPNGRRYTYTVKVMNFDAIGY